MSDFHVEVLYYILRHIECVDYLGAEPLEHEELGFTVRIAEGRADIAMKSDHATTESARAEVEPFLRAWELSAGLEFGLGQFTFVYHQAKIVDRASTPTLFPVVSNFPLLSEILPAHIRRSKYPNPPPPGIKVDEVVAQMFERFKRYQFDRTTLSDAANFCLTVLEDNSGAPKGKRAAAAKRYNISGPVLDTVASLAATKGGAEARKALGAQSEFTTTERDWLEKAIKLIIWRAAEVAGNPSAALPQQITMADLPPRGEAASHRSRLPLRRHYSGSKRGERQPSTTRRST